VSHPHPPEGSVLLGTLGKTFQLQGGLRFYALSGAEAAALAKLKRVFIEGFGERAVARVRSVGAQQVVYFVGVDTPQAAKALVNADVYAPKTALPEPEAGCYVDLLLGLPVLLGGEVLGEVVEVIPSTTAVGQDLLVVDAGGAEHLIPLQADYVCVSEADVQLVNPPEGLLGLNTP
jgi:16S rRNA processing protein RimM